MQNLKPGSRRFQADQEVHRAVYSKRQQHSLDEQKCQEKKKRNLPDFGLLTSTNDKGCMDTVRRVLARAKAPAHRGSHLCSPLPSGASTILRAHLQV